VLIRDEEITGRQADELDGLFQTCFPGMTFRSGPKAAARAVFVDGTIVGHAAYDVRRVVLCGVPVEVALLGLVCVDPAHRGKSIGHTLIGELHRAAALPFVLNCGKDLVGYYARLGYVTIADAAIYDRTRGMKRDDDPVMGCANGRAVSMTFQQEPVCLGADF
jgi:GNAT superfamily N-acetyltransferase